MKPAAQPSKKRINRTGLFAVFILLILVVSKGKFDPDSSFLDGLLDLAGPGCVMAGSCGMLPGPPFASPATKQARLFSADRIPFHEIRCTFSASSA